MLGIIKCNNYSFLLPLKNNKSLLEHWFIILNNICSKIIIIIDDCYKKNVYDFLGENISIINNINLIKNEEYDLCIYVNCNIIIDIIHFNIIDNIKDNYYGGILSWNNIDGLYILKKNIEHILINNEFEENKHLFIKCNIYGLLWDANNINDYKNYISYLSIPNRTYIKGTLIIVSLYIGNIEQSKIDISLNCLINLRTYFQNEFIVIVDNNSYNQDWINLANLLGMYIIKNTSELYRYEIGAYNLALKYFKADKYICIQHNIQFFSKIIQELNMDTPDAYVFQTTTILWMNDDGLKIINKYLNFINMTNWNNDPLAIWNSFYCNDLMMEKIINSGLFDMISNKKEISQAYERILGVFFYRILNYVKVIDENIFIKHLFVQNRAFES
jgi:hypothetical protein